MTKTILLNRRNLLAKLFMLVMLLVGGGSNAWGEELTVNGTTSISNKFIPFYGAKVDVSYVKGETLYQKSQLTAMEGKNITGLKYYASSASVNWGIAEFKVFLKEIATTDYPSKNYDFLGDAGATKVYEGALSVNANKEMIITFTTPFLYTGSNNSLLIGIYCTKQGTGVDTYFYGTSNTTTYYSIVNWGYSSESTTRNSYQPKVTFTYETPVSKTISASPNENAAFGEVYDDANKVYRITNNGSSSITVTPSISEDEDESFSVSPGATVLSAGGYQDFTLTFNYDSGLLGDKSAKLTFTPSDGEYNTIEFTATATAISNNAPELTVSPNEDSSFGVVKANDSKTFTVTNSGTGSMTVNIVSDNATDFSVSKNQITVGAGQSDTFDVLFNFSSERSGERSATITVTPTYDVNDAVEISATATAITQPILSVSTSYVSFGSLKVNSTREITVSNTGYGDMEVNISSSNETFFTVSPSSLTVAQDETETFTVTFNYDPSSLGYKTGTITVTPTYDENDNKNITSSATALEPLFVSPDVTTDFGNVTGNASRTYTITNLGTSNMNVTVALEGTNSTSFSLSESSFSAIPAGESRKFTVTFNYDSESTGSKKSANIVLTANGNSAASLSINSTPRADSYVNLTLDESSTTDSWTNGYKNVKFKYSAKSGWNTFCVPFLMDATNMEYVFGSGCKYYMLSSYNKSTHELTFSKVDGSLSYGIPALVYTESAPTYDNGVVLYRSPNPSTTPGNTQKNSVTFQGTYLPIAKGSFPEYSYGVTSEGRIVNAGSNSSMKGYRAYFNGEVVSTARLMVIEDDDEATDLGFVKMVDPEAKEVYNLKGQRVQKGSKGLYVVNGKKVVIK